MAICWSSCNFLGWCFGTNIGLALSVIGTSSSSSEESSLDDNESEFESKSELDDHDEAGACRRVRFWQPRGEGLAFLLLSLPKSLLGPCATTSQIRLIFFIAAVTITTTVLISIASSPPSDPSSSLDRAFVTFAWWRWSAMTTTTSASPTQFIIIIFATRWRCRRFVSWYTSPSSFSSEDRLAHFPN